MAVLDLDGENRLFYGYSPPTAATGRTFVFFNALTGDAAMWDSPIGDALRGAGHGVLIFNFRGQRDSDFAPGTALTPALIAADAAALLDRLRPPRPVFVGLSIGGLFAARTWLGGPPGADAEGLVLINTLRHDGPRLKWINDAVLRAAEVGGLELFKDLFAPLLFAEPWLTEHRGEFLGDDAYAPLAADSGSYNLLKHAGQADWNVAYESLELPVLVITGLQDHVFLDPQAVAELTARMPRASRLDIADAGHLLPAENPAALSQALLRFAAEI